AHRHLEVLRVAAVRGDAVDRDPRFAELRPADAAMLAHPAAGIVMIHDALADRRLALRNPGPARRDHAAGLVAADERLGVGAEAERLLRLARRRAVKLEVRAAHARGLHLDHHLARAGRGIGEGPDLDLPVAEENHAAHESIL